MLQKQRLVEVTSNLWGTKFKIHGLAPFLPEDLGHILYKTSLLHLQPRQMTIGVMEMNPDNHFCFDNLEQNYNSHQFSESEDEGLFDYVVLSVSWRAESFIYRKSVWGG